MKKVKIVYGTGGGNTEMVCEKVAEVLGTSGIQATLIKTKLSEPSDIGDFDLLIFACPTYGHGQLEHYFGIFFDKCGELDLAGKKCATIALGDIKYDKDYILESANIIEGFFEEKKANVIVKPLKIAKSPVPYLESLIKKWAEGVAELI